jgi:hypothetical protein
VRLLIRMVIWSRWVVMIPPVDRNRRWRVCGGVVARQAAAQAVCASTEGRAGEGVEAEGADRFGGPQLDVHPPGVV